jgi:hypothetical protein
MEEDIVDVGTGCMQPLIRELFVSGDGWEGIEFKPPSPRQLVVQHFDVFHSKKGQLWIGRRASASTGFITHRMEPL